MSEEIQGWRDIIQQNGKIIQPQLTIPKSIADKLDDIFNEFIVENDSELKSQLETLQKKQKNLTKLRGRRKNNKYWIKLFEQDERKALDTSEKEIGRAHV